MAVAIGFHFPLGEYHATPWDRAVNSGDSEWPPSPWRIVRALLSVWHTRCPDLDPQAVDSVIGKLASEPPSFLMPEKFPSHTRHYLPGVSHSDVSRDTAYTLAPRLQLAPKSRVLVHWPTIELDAQERHLLERLVTRLPYLGRAESVCDATLVDPAPPEAIDDRWTVPGEEGSELRVLVPAAGVSRAQLEVTPDAMRKARRLVPEGPGGRAIGRAAWERCRAGRRGSATSRRLQCVGRWPDRCPFESAMASSRRRACERQRCGCSSTEASTRPRTPGAWSASMHPRARALAMVMPIGCGQANMTRSGTSSCGSQAGYLRSSSPHLSG